MIKNKVLQSLVLLGSLISIAQAAETVSQVESDAARIFMLEKAFAPDSPDKLAALFAKANKERNAAVQFMLFSEQLRAQHKSDWPFWVSGVSSPWITGYSIKKTVLAKDSFQFAISYQWATSAGPFKPSLEQTIVVESVPKNLKSSQKWWISSLNEGQ